MPFSIVHALASLGPIVKKVINSRRLYPAFINLDKPVSEIPRSFINSILSSSSNCEISDSISVEI